MRDIKLVFRLHEDAPYDYQIKWKTWLLKFHKFNRKDLSNKNIITSWLNNCKLESNKQLIPLDRSEGGICFNNSNITGKQIRFNIDYLHPNDISMNVINSDNNLDCWTFEQLIDLIDSFVYISNNFINEECVSGYIKLV